MQNLKTTGMLLTLILLGGCVFPGVYKIDVQQGNIIEKETLDQLQVGLNRKQVHFLLGSPVLHSIFDPGYETYIYTIQLAGGEIHRQNLTLYYSNDILKEIEQKEILNASLANPAKAYAYRGKAKTELDSSEKAGDGDDAAVEEDTQATDPSDAPTPSDTL